VAEASSLSDPRAMRLMVTSMALVFFLIGGAGSVLSEDLTLGLVQSQIRNGMTQGEVAQAIGSPNIASKDRDGNEVWIYDKISSETKTESEGDTKGKSSGIAVGGGGLLGGLAGILGGFYSGQGSSSSKAKARVETTKKTLTVVIKFDAKHLVKETNYQMSKF